MNRRKFLKKAGLAAGIGAVGSYLYLNDETMIKPPLKDGYVLCDFHAHPANYQDRDETLTMLASPGLVGLAHNAGTKRNLLYEQAREWAEPFAFREITVDHLASFYEGYFCRAQEVVAGKQHLLAVGWQGDYFENFKDPRAAVEAIHDKDGIVILNHPYMISGGLMYREADDQEEKELEKLCAMVDVIEVHNAQTINLFPVVAWMKEKNERAKQLAERCEKPGVASSDTHRRNEQAKLTGVYVEREIIETFGMPGLKEAIKTGNFILEKDGYVGRGNWLKGMIYEQLCGGKWCGGLF